MRILLIVLVALALAPAASAGTIVNRAAQALANDPVYVDPAATSVSPAEADALRREIAAKGNGPIYIAVLPKAALAEAGGSAVGIADQLHRILGRRGLYAVVAGNQFRAESTDLGKGKAGKLAAAAFRAHHTEGVTPTLLDFIDRVGAARSGSGSSGGGRSFGWWPVVILAVVAFLVYRRIKRRRQDSSDFQAVKETAREDLVALADDVQGLEHKVDANDAARRDYLAALDKYSEASSKFDRAVSAAQLAPVAESLEEGRYLMASAESRLEGKEPPERRPACFFDPRHGPSVRDVEWAPPGGEPRSVPACAADAIRIEQGEEPQSRQVLVGGQATPYWAAGPMYGGYFGGFFPGLLLGELMFGGFGWGGAAGGYGLGGSGDGDLGGGGGLGDFGGGDFGGGGDGGGGGDF
ncbi:MAG TPA: hypothetical protein VGO39_08875 [Gaiellaceae bacterium]|jgi:hypothetical protein|nr:hypothetical protein [Gaiellaceae bacterium]